jgi:tetratricopeptide (TPR) repeat protein
MGEGQLWAQAAALFDPNNIGLKELLQFATFLGTVYGAWKWWRFSKWQIANRLFEYLNTDEKHIIGARRRVLEHLRCGKGIALKSGVELHDSIEEAIKLLDADRLVEAEESLAGFALMLTGSAEVGRRHTAVASEQAATILLFVGLIAKKRADVPSARRALEEAIEHNPDDAEAIRSLGELDVSAGDDARALQRLKNAFDKASNDSRLRAEISQLKLKIYQKRDEPKNERETWHDCAEALSELGQHGQAALAYTRAAEIESTRLPYHQEARRSYRAAFDSYYQAGDSRGVEQMKEALKTLGADVDTLPALNHVTPGREIPWFWIRLGLELSILAAAGYLFLTLR